ncbi:hypothetical protein FXB40_00820 [Bradyrhizobium rifense]|uniref:Uncharacterized protein n=1 Tax=Bradyrhizobium rifense TaxID=515499 RepID=A0A5D3KSS9_9BRAD|nr:hypothetical protein [Bradyrhizobium rifense]TYM00098.1 hypothetical protein FXB40_00820 [Bradyrhizobium rifense]
MPKLENLRSEERRLGGWNIAAALGLLAVALLIDRGAPPNQDADDASPMPSKEKRGASASALSTEAENGGRHAKSP